MSFNPTTKTNEALQAALKSASAAGNPDIRPGHLLVALLEQPDGIAGPLLTAAGVEPTGALARARALVAGYPSAQGSNMANPQFNRDVLPASLDQYGIGHEYIGELGGLRKVAVDSPNGGWRNKSFQGYADHMLTEEFQRGIGRLVAAMTEHTVAIMCAEAVWWRCHRSLVAEAMLVRGFDVSHIMPDGRAVPATLRDFAVVDGTSITYPSAAAPG